MSTKNKLHIINRTHKIICEHLGVNEDKMKPDAHIIDDLGADSLDCVELVMAFEEEFGIMLNDNDVESIMTVGAIVKHIDGVINSEVVREPVGDDKVPMREPALFDVMTGANTLQDGCHSRAYNNGWWHDADGEEFNHDVTTKDGLAWVMAKLLLIVTEVAEATEGARKNLKDDHLPHRDMLEVELADTVIRCFDLAGGLGYELGDAIRDKLEYNAQRPDHKPENRGKAEGKKI